MTYYFYIPKQDIFQILSNAEWSNYYGKTHQRLAYRLQDRGLCTMRES